jgi:hypothetical protein
MSNVQQKEEKDDQDNGYEYKEKINDEKFHGFGSLLMKIRGLIEINKPPAEKD